MIRFLFGEFAHIQICIRYLLAAGCEVNCSEDIGFLDS